MKEPQKHREVIIAWANGEEIEFRCPGQSHWSSILNNPFFHNDNEYRIKPTVVRYRLWLSGGPFGEFKYSVKSHNEHECCPEKDYGFVKWISDWQWEEAVGIDSGS